MSTKLPSFNNWTLSILILLLIPLIFLLHQMGPKEGDLRPLGQEGQLFALADLELIGSEQSFGPAWRLDLDSDELVLLFKLKAIPSQQWPMPDWVDWHSQWRAGHLLLSLRLPAQQRAYQDLLLLIEEWLPAEQLVGLAAIGANTDASWQALLQTSQQLRGQGQISRPRIERDITTLTSPDTGTVEQLAFILASQWLRPQLQGYAPDMRWSHSYSPSQLLINQSLPRQLEPMDEESFALLQQQLLQQAAEPRNLAQISSYMLVLLAENLGSGFITQQAERIAALQLSQINQHLQQFSEQ